MMAPERYFEQHAERLLDQGYHPIPVRPRDKAPVVRGWQRWCARPPDHAVLEKLVANKPGHSVGLACGKSIVAVDIDIEDQDQAIRIEGLAKEVLGETPLLRIGKEPKRALIYQSAERIRSTSWTTAGGGIDLLADKRQIVAFGIHPRTGRPYIWPHESPLDVHRDRLPAITDAQVLVFREATATTAATIEPGPVAGGPGRNAALFKLCKNVAAGFEVQQDLEAFALEMNGSSFDSPLPEAEVLRCASSAWNYRIKGTIIPSGCEPWARVSESDLTNYADNLEAFWLLCRLRAAHRPGERFAISPKPLAATLPKPLNRPGKIRAARRALLARRDLILLHQGGRGPGDPSLYRLGNKGTESVPQYNYTPLPSSL